MYFSNVDIDEITHYLTDEHVERSVYVIMLAEEEMFSATSLIDLFNMKGATFSGGIFPMIIHEGTLHKKGVIIKRYPGKGKTFVLENLKDGPALFDNMIEYVSEQQPEFAFLFIDGLSNNIAEYLTSLYRFVGSGAKYFGAGAGTSDLLEKPVLFSEKGLIEDGMVVMFTELDAYLSVKHGWQPFKGPLLVTETVGNKVKTINWKDAFSVYKEALGRNARSMTPANFSETSIGYPLGIHREDSEPVIRTPIAVTEKKELTCMGNVDDNAMIYIMKGSSGSLRAAAAEAARESILHVDKAESVMVFESLSRYWFLGSGIEKEIATIQETFNKYPGHINMTGALSLGTVASLPSGYLDFFCKSVLIGAFNG